MNSVLESEDNCTFSDILCVCTQSISEDLFRKADPDLFETVVAKITGKKTEKLNPLQNNCQIPECTNKADFQNNFENCGHWCCNKCIEKALTQVAGNSEYHLEDVACFCSKPISKAYLQSTFPQLMEKIEGPSLICLDCKGKTILKNQICECPYCSTCIKK